jgi:hypothetical protein
VWVGMHTPIPGLARHSQRVLQVARGGQVEAVGRSGEGRHARGKQASGLRIATCRFRGCQVPVEAWHGIEISIQARNALLRSFRRGRGVRCSCSSLDDGAATRKPGWAQ